MHPQFLQALTRQRIDEIHEDARRLRARSRFSLRLRWAPMRPGRTWPFSGQLGSEAR
jgi:hypothetical protein